MAYGILVIDDEALTLRTISRALRDEGFDVFVAMSGEEGLQVLAEERPELALLDVVLPGIDGIEVLRQIRQKSPNTIVVMMSAYRMVDRAVEAMKLGAYDYLIKPVDLDELQLSLQSALRQRQLEIERRELEQWLAKEVAVRTRDLEERTHSIATIAYDALAATRSWAGEREAVEKLAKELGDPVADVAAEVKKRRA